MSSIIEGYNYDIFISYRQKDNKGDRWVSAFVDSLKTELESTFKEEISVYFDINPHDGLLETHDVDASLKEKLKCLVFIPIISRTYCDPKSFAWEHEFKVFVELASQDQIGLKVRLPNGNVASRVLPIRIHDLETADIKECESVLGGVLRGIEFIYKEPGVNKPLTANDNEKKNLNNTIYKIQINKTANAIKEIIAGLKTGPVRSKSEKIQLKVAEEEINRETNLEEPDKPGKFKVIKLLSGFLISALIIAAALILYPKIFKRDTLEKLRSSGERISIAVMPFQNMTNDTTWNIWQDGIQDLLITSLSNHEELKIRQGESTKSLIKGIGITNYASITPSVASEISKKLDASIFIFGSIKTAGLIIRVNAQLINSESGEVYKSFEIDGPSREEMIFNIVDSLRNQIKNFIIISVLKKKVSPDIQPYTFTNSPDAYRFFIHGRDAYNKSDFQTAFNLLSQSVAIDSNFVFANIMLSWTYFYLEGVKQAKDCFLRTYKNRNLMPLKVRIFADYTYALYATTPDDAIKCLRQLQEIDDRDPSVYFYLGNRYNDLLQPERAIPEYEKALEIYNDLGSRPSYSHNYVFLGMAYHKTGQYKKEEMLYKRATQDFPDNPELLSRQIILSFTVGDTVKANQYIDEYESLLKNTSSTEATTLSNLAKIYSEASILDKAEEYFREANSLEPENLYGLYNLASFLIDKDRNINEGLELIDQALALSPDNYLLLNIKGWGLYKQDKFKEALDILENSWNLKPSYDHGIFLHLEAAKKAFANQKTN